MRIGDGNGDSMTDFDGAGAGAGDLLWFFGFGTGTSVIQINATVWAATGSNGTIQFTLANAAGLHASDYEFL